MREKGLYGTAQDNTMSQSKTNNGKSSYILITVRKKTDLNKLSQAN